MTATGRTNATGGANGTGGSIASGATAMGGTTATGGTNCGTVADPGKKGPLATKSYSSGLRDGSAYGSQTMHYPIGGNAPYPAVVIVPGFMSAESSIGDWGPYFASHGIAVLTIGTNSTLDQPPARAEALLDALATIKAENSRAGSPVQGNLDLTRLGVMGWSMGGGGTLIVVNGHPELKAAITLCAWNPGQSYGSTKVPTLMFAGTADTLAGGQSQGFYTSIPASTPKMLFEVQGADHFYANTPR
jgi:dienelactone hydrolase